MTDLSLTVDLQVAADEKRKATIESISRLTKYSAYKLAMLIITVVIGIYLTILIANMGGYVDKIRRGQIRENVSLAASSNPKMREMPYEERAKLIEDQVRIQEDRLGLNKPFIVRSFGFLQNALTLNLGRAENLTSDSGSRQVKAIILERLPSTLVLFVTANLINFILSVFFALMLSRKYGHFMDKVVVALSPMSAAPGWFYGIFLILIFSATLKILPFGGMVSAPPPETTLGYGLSLMRHMILPIAALTISSIFGAIYSWRTFFLIYSSEDYVEMAKAKGLNDRDIERKYILRPTLPNIITNFALSLIFAWQGAIILESVFNWPGLGRLFFFAIGQYDTPVIVGITVIFAYLLALTVFLLDFIYALVDPRVKIGSEGSKA
jgi:peptide/nickel transport system permease protein